MASDAPRPNTPARGKVRVVRVLLCCGAGHSWRSRAVCVLDNLCHMVGCHFDRVCDTHERTITGTSTGPRAADAGDEPAAVLLSEDWRWYSDRMAAGWGEPDAGAADGEPARTDRAPEG